MKTKEEIKNNKEIQQAKKGKIHAVVFLNKYREPIFCLPSKFEKTYFFDSERGDIKVKKITKENLKKILKITNQIHKLIKKKEDLIKNLILQKK